MVGGAVEVGGEPSGLGGEVVRAVELHQGGVVHAGFEVVEVQAALGFVLLRAVFVAVHALSVGVGLWYTVGVVVSLLHKLTIGVNYRPDILLAVSNVETITFIACSIFIKSFIKIE